MAVTPEERSGPAEPAEGQLAFERRLGPRIGIASLVAAGFVVASFLSQLSLLREKTKTEADTLLSVHRHAGGYIAGGLLQLVALALLAAVFWFLYRAAKHRRPQTPPIALILGIAGPIAFGIAGAIGPFVVRHFANEFAALPKSQQTVHEAKQLVSGSAASVFGIVTPITGLAFAFAMIMTNVNVMRAGLVSTFTGIIGVIAGLLFVLPLGPPQLLTFFWLLAVGVVLLDRWPGGRGPAWASGEAIKWPTAADRRGLTQPRGGPAPAAPPEEPQDAERPAAQRSSRKRKRKQGRKH